jgi:hypothetical protein
MYICIYCIINGNCILRQAFLRVLRFLPVNNIPPLLSKLISSGGWTSCPLVTAVQRHSLSPSKSTIFRPCADWATPVPQQFLSVKWKFIGFTWFSGERPLVFVCYIRGVAKKTFGNNCTARCTKSRNPVIVCRACKIHISAWILLSQYGE